MPELKFGDPFGMDASAIKRLDLDLANTRILNDIKTDFIYAPHLNLIYSKAFGPLQHQVMSDLSSGQFSPGLPISIEVPKSFRIPLVPPKQLGPPYSRLGSILYPKDRLLYQAIADQATNAITQVLDPTRCFSHIVGPDKSPSMFMPTRKCWNNLQNAIAQYAGGQNVLYVMKLDIADYFGSINLHVLTNTLNDSGLDKAYLTRLEMLLTCFTGQRSSRGILQGIYPSDLFGNFYMAPIDKILRDMGISSARYVDDLYIFLGSVDQADRVLRDLIPVLRINDLSLNESKCKIIPKDILFSVEPDLNKLFQAAVDEVAEQLNDEEFAADYGFQSEWEQTDVNEPTNPSPKIDITLAATIQLFESIKQHIGQEENVERFCLPLFARAGSSFAMNHVMIAFKLRPAMSQIYCSYLVGFVNEQNVRTFLCSLVSDSALMDWQRMWVLAALMQGTKVTDAEVKLASDIVRDGTRTDVLRAVAAYFVGRRGDISRRAMLRSAYGSLSPYIQTAIYASSRNWPAIEKSNAKAMWGQHGQLNALLSRAFTMVR